MEIHEALRLIEIVIANGEEVEADPEIEEVDQGN